MTNPFDDFKHQLDQEKQGRAAKEARFVGEYNEMVLRVLGLYRDAFFPDYDVFGPEFAYAFARWGIGVKDESQSRYRSIVRVSLHFDGEHMANPTFGVQQNGTYPISCPATEADLVAALKNKAAARGGQ